MGVYKVGYSPPAAPSGLVRGLPSRGAWLRSWSAGPLWSPFDGYSATVLVWLNWGPLHVPTSALGMGPVLLPLHGGDLVPYAPGANLMVPLRGFTFGRDLYEVV